MVFSNIDKWNIDVLWNENWFLVDECFFNILYIKLVLEQVGTIVKVNSLSL